MDLNELKEKISDCGIVGAGGAGFPSHVKLSNQARTVILNCAECEPLFRVDRQLLGDYTEEILKTLSLIVEAVGAEKGIVALKATYKKALAAVGSYISMFNNIDVHILPDVYPMGDEVVLVYETTGRIVPEGEIPLSVGALVFNAETVFNIYNSLFNSKPVTHKFVTVNGEVNNACTLRVPIGTSIRNVLNYAGGTKVNNYAILAGGPMTGRLTSINDFITKTTKAIIVLPENHPVIIKKSEKLTSNLRKVMSVCSQCRMCTDLCPRHLLGYGLSPNKIMQASSMSFTNDISTFTSSLLCSECGLCEMYSCHQSLSPRRIIGEIKAGLRRNGVKNPHNRKELYPDIMRFGRMVPMDRLITRLGLKKYDSYAELMTEAVVEQKVNIALSQHVGVSAVPVVKIGDKVRSGQLIADMEKGKLGSKIHSSIDGIVKNINNTFITIESRGENIG